MKTVALPRPENIEADVRFAEPFADRIVNKNWWRISCVALVVAVLGLVATVWRMAGVGQEVVVIRVDDVGRAQRVGLSSLGSGYQPREQEIKFFIGTFVVDFYSRRRSDVIQRSRDSLLFLDSRLAQARIEHERKTKEIQTFMRDGSDEIDIAVRNVIPGDLSRTPYTAQVDMEKVYMRNGTESHREKYIVSLAFIRTKTVPNAAVDVNPLGFVVTDLRADEAFK